LPLWQSMSLTVMDSLPCCVALPARVLTLNDGLHDPKISSAGRRKQATRKIAARHAVQRRGAGRQKLPSLSLPGLTGQSISPDRWLLDRPVKPGNDT
jgi:hypothetical protein